jgi:multicomponent Na+:H+ antiporter subunit A
MRDILIIITLPILAGFLLLLIPEKLRTLRALLLSAAVAAGYLSVLIYGTDFQAGTLDEISRGSGMSVFGIDLFRDAVRYAVFGIDNLSKLIILFISLFSILILLYSIVYIRNGRAAKYYTWFLVTIGCSYGAALADNLLLFLTFWGILGITLYKLIPGHNEESSATAKKTLILIGASDTIMIIGIAIVWRLTGSLSMSSISLPTSDALTVTAFIALLAGSFTKAGAFPFHSWVPDYTRMPASLHHPLSGQITWDLFRQD